MNSNIGANQYLYWKTINENPIYFIISYPYMQPTSDPSLSYLYTGMVDSFGRAIFISSTTNPVKCSFERVIHDEENYVQLFISYNYASVFLFSPFELKIQISNIPLLPDT